MTETQSASGSKKRKLSYTDVIPVLKQVISEGTINYDDVRKEVRRRLKSEPGVLTDDQLRNAWSNARNYLIKKHEISHIHELHIIVNPLDDIISKIQKNILSKDEKIVEIGLKQLSDITEKYSMSLHPQIIQGLEQIVLNFDEMSQTCISYYLEVCENILDYNYKNKPEGYSEMIIFIDKLVGVFYNKIDCSVDENILKQSLELVPKNTTSDGILKSLYKLIDCLPQESFQNIQYNMSWILFDPKYRIAREHNQEIDSNLVNMVTNQTGKTQERAYFLLSQKKKLLKK